MMLFALFLYVPIFSMYHLHVLCIVHVFSLFIVVQIKYNVKRLELFKIRRYIKCPLLLLLLSPNNVRESFGRRAPGDTQPNLHITQD